MKMSEAFDFEKWVREHTDWEDPDTIILVTEHKDGKIAITNYNGNKYAVGKTLKEACEEWDKDE